MPTNESDTTRLYGRSDRPFFGAWETSRFGQKQWYGQIPDYPHDLNGMYEAELVLISGPAGAAATYVAALEKIYPNEYWRATAAQRAEAFLRVLGLWKD